MVSSSVSPKECDILDAFFKKYLQNTLSIYTVNTLSWMFYSNEVCEWIIFSGPKLYLQVTGNSIVSYPNGSI